MDSWGVERDSRPVPSDPFLTSAWAHSPEQCVRAPCAGRRRTWLGRGGAQLPCPSPVPRGVVLASPQGLLSKSQLKEEHSDPLPPSSR